MKLFDRTHVLAASLFVLSAAAPPAAGGGITVSEVDIVLAPNEAPATAVFDVGWANGWRNDRNHDAAWVFLRQERPGSGGTTPARLARTGRHAIEPAAADAPRGAIVAPGDGVGVFVRPDEAHRGDARWTVRLELDEGASTALRSDNPPRMTAHAIEMVYVPAGAFTLGDPGEEAGVYASFYRSDARGGRAGLYRVEDESPIPVGPRSGALHYPISEGFAQYEGDQRGPVPAAFPKGTRAFYIMKYEISQGGYAAFLNSLFEGQTGHRSPIGHRSYAANRGTIRLAGGVYEAAAPDRPANFVSWDDGCGFADWAGLRPMTELEYTKACRGPLEPIPGELPWNTASGEQLVRVMDPSGELATSGPADESLLGESSRARFGASFYWVMDLAGSVWERCVTIGHPRGRAFEGSHGDGQLTNLGYATNADWPLGDDDGGGYGYRGGGQYDNVMQFRVGQFNPYSPIGWRRFGSWGGAPRHVAYGFRGVRAAPE